MNHQHLPTKFILRDATKDLFKNLWKYVNKKDGTAKCAICGKTIAVPGYEGNKFASKFFTITAIIAFVFGIIGYGLRYLVFLYFNIDFINTIWGIVGSVVLGVLMVFISYLVRRLVICHYWVNNEWTEIGLPCDKKTIADLKKEISYYRADLFPSWALYAGYIFYKGLTLSL